MSLGDSSVFNSETYSAPESSPDPYASSEQVGYPIDISRLPATKIGRIFIRNYDSVIDAAIKQRLALVANEIKRPLRPEEADALAFHTSKGVATMSLGLPAGTLFGLFRTYKTRKTFRFPFAGPLKSENGWFNGERIRLLGLETAGPHTRILVHGFRLSAIVLMSVFVCKYSLNSFAGTVMAIREAQDPMLVNVMRELRRAKYTEIEEMKAKITKIIQKRESAGKRAEIDDDNSPMTEGFEDERFGSRQSQVPTDDAQPSPQKPKQQFKPRRSNTQQKPPSPSPPQTPQPEPYNLPNNSSAPDDKSSPRNIWEQIRREAGSSTPKARRGIGEMGRRQTRQEDDSPGDDYTFSRAELDGGDVDGEAQREFDERVERERRGGDFNDVGGDDGTGDGNVAGAGWRRERKRRAL